MSRCLLAWLPWLILGWPIGPAVALGATELVGHVTNSDGVPIEEARVHLLGTTISALTEDDGFFQLDRAPWGEFTLQVSASDHLSWAGRVTVPASDVGGLEISLVPRNAAPHGWAETFSETQRFGGDEIRNVPASLRRAEVESDDAFAARVSVQSNGHFDPDVGSDAFHHGALELGGKSAGGAAHFFVATSGESEETISAEGGLLRESPLGFFPSWTEEADAGRVLARLQILPGHSYTLNADLEYSAAEGQAYAHMWSRAGYVQTFRDTTQSGDVVLRHGRFSPTRIDESYQPFETRDHLPTEEERSLAMRAVFDQRLGDRLRYAAHASYERQTLDSRVDGKNAWEYEGERGQDFWFNYTDRVAEEFFVIANDFPRVAEGELTLYSGGLDFEYGEPGTVLELGLGAGYRDSRYFELLYPYGTDANGEIGRIKTRHHGFDPSGTAYVRKSWQVEELRLGAGLAYEGFHLMEEYPVQPVHEELEHELLPRVELEYPLTPKVQFSFLGERTVRRPTPDRDRALTEGLQGEYRVVDDLVPESAVILRAALAGRFGGRNRAELAFYYEDRSDPFAIDQRPIPGSVSPGAYLANGRSSQARGIQLQLSRSFDDRFGGTLRYTFGESRTSGLPSPFPVPQVPEEDETPADDDVRHRLELSLDLGTPGTVWTSTRLSYASGAPFTPDFHDWAVVEDPNSKRLPSTVTVDIDVEHQLDVLGQPLSLFFRGRNVLDTQNIADLDPLNWPGPPSPIGNEYVMYYTETGRTGGAYLTADGPAQESGEWIPVSDPRVLAPSRDLRFGLAVSF